jgi:hypothetical protein
MLKTTEVGGFGGGVSTPFNPMTDLADIVHGWRADLGITKTGSDIDQWDDQVSSLNLTPNGGGTNPTLLTSAVNGQDAIDFAGDGTSLKSGGTATISHPFLYVTVFKHNTWSDNDRLAASSVDNGTIGQKTSTPNIGQSDDANVNLNSDFTLGSWFLLRCLFSNSTGDYMLANDGTKSTGANAGATVFTEPFAIGANLSAPSNRSIDAAVAEFLILDADLTGSDETAYLAYVTARYGISM